MMIVAYSSKINFKKVRFPYKYEQLNVSNRTLVHRSNCTNFQQPDTWLHFDTGLIHTHLLPLDITFLRTNKANKYKMLVESLCMVCGGLSSKGKED